MPPGMLRCRHVGMSAFLSYATQQGDVHPHKYAYWLLYSKQLCIGHSEHATLGDSFVRRRNSVLTCTFELRLVKHVYNWVYIQYHCKQHHALISMNPKTVIVLNVHPINCVIARVACINTDLHTQ